MHYKWWTSRTTKAVATAFTVLLAALIFAYAAFGGAADVGVLGMMVGIIMYGAPLSSTLAGHHGRENLLGQLGTRHC